MKPLMISNAGMITGLANNAPANSAAIRLAYSSFEESEFKDPVSGQPVIGSQVNLPTRGVRRLADLLYRATDEAYESVLYDARETVGIVCLGDTERPSLETHSIDTLNDYLSNDPESHFYMHLENRFVLQGATGFVAALAQAEELIYEQKVKQVVIAGTDSLLNAPDLAYFIGTGIGPVDQVNSNTNAYGFIPGEAAAAVVITQPRKGTDKQLCITGIGHGLELTLNKPEQANRAEGLVEAVKLALESAGCALSETVFRMSNINGLPVRFEEDALMLHRMLDQPLDDHPLWLLADCIGEVGAAIGPAMVCKALWALRKEYAPGQKLLCHLSHFGPQRAAFVAEYCD